MVEIYDLQGEALEVKKGVTKGCAVSVSSMFRCLGVIGSLCFLHQPHSNQSMQICYAQIQGSALMLNAFAYIVPQTYSTVQRS